MGSDLAESLVMTARAAGLTVADLAEAEAHLDGGETATRVTLGDYWPTAIATLGKNTARTYRSYVRLFAGGAGATCRCDCPKCLAYPGGGCSCGRDACKERFAGYGGLAMGRLGRTEVAETVAWARLGARKRAHLRNIGRARRSAWLSPETGKGASENCVTALRWLFAFAQGDARTTGVTNNPAAALTKPARDRRGSRALNEEQLSELWQAALSGGDDPELDALIIWIHMETGARQGGALSLLVGRIDEIRQVITLVEKGDMQRSQPVSADLIAALLEHATHRGPVPLTSNDPVLYYKPRCVNVNGVVERIPHPLTSRRYDTLFLRIQKQLPWAAAMGMRAHDIRHTVGTLVERVSSFAIARQFLGHLGEREPTDTYTRASLSEVASAVSRLQGAPHPLAVEKH